MKNFKLLFLLCFTSLISCFHFDISIENQRCFYEELFKGSVAIINYEIWSTPNSVDKCIFY